MKTTVNSSRGMHFEKRVMNRLQSHFDPDCIFYNLNIPGRKDGETQIDFVLLDRTGIYIIEAKGYSGTVTGTFEDVKWTKTLTSRNGNTWKKKVMNPLFQNRGHIRYLKKLFADETIPMFSIAVISEKCDLSAVTGSHRGEYVFNIKEFSTKMEELISSKRKSLNEGQLAKVKTVLKNQKCCPMATYHGATSECQMGQKE